MTTTINADTSAGLISTADTSGIVKLQSNGKTTNALAWVNFTGASATINASYNISSITRSAAGSYTITFTTATTDANYVVGATSTATSSGPTLCSISAFWQGTTYTAPTTSAFKIGVQTPATASLNDPSQAIGVIVFGN